MGKKNYWCYRVDTSKIKFFTNELNEGRLRRGWGWDEAQDLRNFKLDEGAGRNRPMFNKVKGDILLIPQLQIGVKLLWLKQQKIGIRDTLLK